jgi:hypothetical protein
MKIRIVVIPISYRPSIELVSKSVISKRSLRERLTYVRVSLSYERNIELPVIILKPGGNGMVFEEFPPRPYDIVSA